MSYRVDRRARTEDLLASVRERVRAGIATHASADATKMYASHRAALGTFFDGLLGGIAKKIPDAAGPSGAVYRDCLDVELRLLAVQRVWDAYAVRLAQFADPRYGPALVAASEVIWSCLAAARAATTVTTGAEPTLPPPVPFVEASWSPAAYPSDVFPADVLAGVSQPLRDLLNRLPIPMVRLPPSVLDAPWLYALLGHEVGHVLHHDLVPGLKAEAAVAIGGVVPAAQKLVWSAAAQELVADLCSVLLLGPAATLVMIEVEHAASGDGGWTAMRPAEGGRAYPSRAARLVLLSRWGGSKEPAEDLKELLGERGDDDIAGFLAGAAGDATVAAVGTALASSAWANGHALGDLIGAAKPTLGTGHPLLEKPALRALANAPDSPVAEAKRRLAPDATRAREVAAGLVWAWADADGDDERRKRLCALAPSVLAACRTPGVRAGAAPAAVDDLAAEGAALFTQLPTGDLGGRAP